MRSIADPTMRGIAGRNAALRPGHGDIRPPNGCYALPAHVRAIPERPPSKALRAAPGAAGLMAVQPMAVAHVPAPAKTSTNPVNIAASMVDRVQGVRMWITPSPDQNSLD
jgi:hypothetical protein